MTRIASLFGALILASSFGGPLLGAAIPNCRVDTPNGISTIFLSETTPDCQLGNTDIFFGNAAICETAVNAQGTDCTGDRSDVISFQPIFQNGMGLPIGTEVIICSDQSDGDQVDNNRPAACNGAGGLFVAATTVAYVEAPGEVGNPVTMFKGKANLPGGKAQDGVPSYQLSDTPEPAPPVLFGLGLGVLILLTARASKMKTRSGWSTFAKRS
jgi:hypothetical protein